MAPAARAIDRRTRRTCGCRAGDLDDQSAAGSQQAPRRAEAAKRVVVVLEEVPHRHHVEPGAPEVDVVEETVVELGSLEERARRQVLEIQTGRLNAVVVAQPLKKGTGSASDVEDRRHLCQRAVARHETVLGEVELPHRAVEERRQEAPIACLPMRNVAVVVELGHRLEGESRILVRQPALRARHEPEPSGPAGEVVFREEQLGALRAATQVAADRFRRPGRQPGRCRTCRRPLQVVRQVRRRSQCGCGLHTAPRIESAASVTASSRPSPRRSAGRAVAGLRSSWSAS